MLESRQMDEVNRRTHPRGVKYKIIVVSFIYHLCTPKVSITTGALLLPRIILWDLEEDAELGGNSVTPKFSLL